MTEFIKTIILFIGLVVIFALYIGQLKKVSKLIKRINDLEEVLLSDPNEDTALLNYMDNYKKHENWTIDFGKTFDHRKIEGTSFRDIIRGQMILEKQESMLPVGVRLIKE